MIAYRDNDTGDPRPSLIRDAGQSENAASEIERLRAAIQSICDMAESRSRVNMPNGQSLGTFCRLVLSQ